LRRAATPVTEFYPVVPMALASHRYRDGKTFAIAKIMFAIAFFPAYCPHPSLNRAMNYQEMTMNFAKHNPPTNALQPRRCGTASCGLRADRPLVGEDNSID
jgi:hypothetical protein